MAGEETKDGLMSFLINAASFGLMKAKNEADDEKEKKEKEPEKVENAEIDKREEMSDVGGFLKSKGLSDEYIKHVYKLMEKLSYDKSETGKADNKAKNEDDDKDKEAKNKCKNEDKEKELEKEVDETAENKKAKNALEDNKNKFYEGGNTTVSNYVSREERLQEGLKY